MQVAFTVQCGYGIKLATLESNPDHVAELGQVLGLIQVSSISFVRSEQNRTFTYRFERTSSHFQALT